MDSMDETDGEPAVGVILAAGSGSRFRGSDSDADLRIHKLLCDFGGQPLYQWALDSVVAAGLEPWVVWGALGEQAPALDTSVTVLHNAFWEKGMATSLQVAVAHARLVGVDSLVVGLADQPLIPASAWIAVARTTSTPIAVATYGGQRRNPVRLGSVVWDLLPLTGDQGARSVIEMRPELVTEVACVGNPADIDTREDLQLWSSSTNSSSTNPSTKPGRS